MASLVASRIASVPAGRPGEHRLEDDLGLLAEDG